MHNLSVHRQSRKSPLRGDMDPTEFSTETDLGESDVHPLNQVAFWYGQPSLRGIIFWEWIQQKTIWCRSLVFG